MAIALEEDAGDLEDLEDDADDEDHGPPSVLARSSYFHLVEYLGT